MGVAEDNGHCPFELPANQHSRFGPSGLDHSEKLFMGYPFFGSCLPIIGIQIPNKFNSKTGVYNFVAIY